MIYDKHPDRIMKFEHILLDFAQATKYYTLAADAGM